MGLLAYSGITTKVRAMESRLLKPEQFQELAEQEDVRSAADYLKAQPAYAEVFEGLDDTKLHRGYMEQILTQSEYRDFTRLYRFSGVKQRRFLDLYFKHYEVEVIKIIFVKYINTTMGVEAIAAFLNESGYVKKKRQNNTIDGFAASFVKGVIDNPVYCGKLAYGRRKTEKVQGKRNEFHVVKQDEFMVVDGEHEAIISAEE